VIFILSRFNSTTNLRRDFGFIEADSPEEAASIINSTIIGTNSGTPVLKESGMEPMTEWSLKELPYLTGRPPEMDYR
jgi:hypothetical protein